MATNEATATPTKRSPGRPKGSRSGYTITPAAVEARRDAATTHGLYRSRTSVTRSARQRINRYIRALHDLLPWAMPTDQIAIKELAGLLVRADMIDGHLSRVGELTESGEAKRLVGERRQLSAEIRAWSDRLGLSPQSRLNLGLTAAQTAATGKTIFEYVQERAGA